MSLWTMLKEWRYWRAWATSAVTHAASASASVPSDLIRSKRSPPCARHSSRPYPFRVRAEGNRDEVEDEEVGLRALVGFPEAADGWMGASEHQVHLILHIVHLKVIRH